MADKEEARRTRAQPVREGRPQKMSPLLIYRDQDENEKLHLASIRPEVRAQSKLPVSAP